MIRIPTHIIIHHSQTKDSGTVSWSSIEDYHTKINGWKDIGYHAGVELVSNSVVTRYQALKGRNEFTDASACPQGNMNSVGLHVCCIGNFDLDYPSINLLDTLVNRVLIDWVTRYNIPLTNIQGHRDFNSAKSCPGKNFNLPRLRHLMKLLLLT